MAGSGPNILVASENREEWAAIAELLRDAGFRVVAADDRCGAAAVLQQEGFAAAVVALPDGEQFLVEARRQRAGLPALLIADPAFASMLDEDDGRLLKRPYDARQLLGCVFELVLRTDDPPPVRQHGHTAEFGIAAARLACLRNRHADAAAAGASRLAQEISRQIGEAWAAHRDLAAAIGCRLAAQGASGTAD